MSTAGAYARRNGIRSPRWSKEKYPFELIKWDFNNVMKLREIYLRVPRPSNEAIAAEMRTTTASIQSALSRHGLTRQRSQSSGFTCRTERRQRDCYRCEKPFLSEHAGIRHCPLCRVWLARDEAA